MRFCIVYATFFPYHIDRLFSVSSYLEEHFPNDKFYALQLCDKTFAYQWPRDLRHARVSLDTLIRSTAVQDLNFVTVFFSSYRYLLSKSVDLLFVPSYWPSYNIALLLAAKILNIRVILMTDSHKGSESSNRISKFFKKLFINSFDGAFVAGQPHVNYLQSMGFVNKPIVTKFDAINNNLFSSSIAPSNSTSFCILCVCRFLPKKNLSLLLEAFVEFLESFRTSNDNNISRPKLLLVGNGPELSSMVEYLRLNALTYAFFPSSFNLLTEQVVSSSIGLDVDVIFYDYREPSFVQYIYNYAHVFVLPSLSEEWGLVVNEAMSSALPVIVSSQVGCSIDLLPLDTASASSYDFNSQFYASTNGFIFENNSLQGLLSSLVSIYNIYTDDYSYYVQMSQSSLNIIADFSVENHARNLVHLAHVFD